MRRSSTDPQAGLADDKLQGPKHRSPQHPDGVNMEVLQELADVKRALAMLVERMDVPAKVSHVKPRHASMQMHALRAHQRHFLPPSLREDTSWEHDEELMDALADIARHYAPPGPLGEGSEPTAMSIPEERVSPAGPPRLMRASGTLQGADKAQLITSMLQRPKPTFRDIVQMTRMKSNRAELLQPDGQDAGPSGEGEQHGGPSWPRHSLRSPSGAFASVREEDTSGDSRDVSPGIISIPSSRRHSQGYGRLVSSGLLRGSGRIERRGSTGALAQLGSGRMSAAGAVAADDRPSANRDVESLQNWHSGQLGSVADEGQGAGSSPPPAHYPPMSSPAQGPGRDMSTGTVGIIRGPIVTMHPHMMVNPLAQPLSLQAMVSQESPSGVPSSQRGGQSAGDEFPKPKPSVTFHMEARGHVSTSNPGMAHNSHTSQPQLQPHPTCVKSQRNSKVKDMLNTMTFQDFAMREVRPTCMAVQVCGQRIDVGATLRYLLWDVWSPADPLRVGWDCYMLLMLLYVITVVPYAIAFDISTGDISSTISIVDLLINIFFLIDVYLNFKTAYPDDDGNLVTSRKHIAIHYLQGWFWIDFFSSLPYDLMFGSEFGLLKIVRTARVVKVLKVLRVLRMLKLLRMMRLKSFLHWLEDIVGKAVMRLSTFIATVFTLLHWDACLFYFVAANMPEHENTWIKQFLGDDNGEVTMPYVDRYITALYWSITTMCTVGFGDVVPISIPEKLIGMGTMLLGASVFGYFLGAMAAVIGAMNSVHARMARKKAAVDDFLRHRKIPKRLSEKIQSYYSYIVEREVHADEADIIAGLSTSLRMQVVLHLYREALEKVPFFRGKHPQFITTLITYLKLEYYSPGDVIVRQGDMGNEMYFVGEGTTEVRIYEEPADGSQSNANSMHGANMAAELPEKPRRKSLLGFRGAKKKNAEARMDYINDLTNMPYTTVGTLSAGQYFGEYSCMLGEPRIATVVATSYCELYSLSRADLEAVVAAWPELAEELSLLVQDNTMETDAWEVREQMGIPLRRTTMAYSESQAQMMMDGNRSSAPQARTRGMSVHGTQSTKSAAAAPDSAVLKRSFSLPQKPSVRLEERSSLTSWRRSSLEVSEPDSSHRRGTPRSMGLMQVEGIDRGSGDAQPANHSPATLPTQGPLATVCEDQAWRFSEGEPADAAAGVHDNNGALDSGQLQTGGSHVMGDHASQGSYSSALEPHISGTGDGPQRALVQRHGSVPVMRRPLLPMGMGMAHVPPVAHQPHSGPLHSVGGVQLTNSYSPRTVRPAALRVIQDDLGNSPISSQNSLQGPTLPTAPHREPAGGLLGHGQQALHIGILGRSHGGGSAMGTPGPTPRGLVLGRRAGMLNRGASGVVEDDGVLVGGANVIMRNMAAAGTGSGGFSSGGLGGAAFTSTAGPIQGLHGLVPVGQRRAAADQTAPFLQQGVATLIERIGNSTSGAEVSSPPGLGRGRVNSGQLMRSDNGMLPRPGSKPSVAADSPMDSPHASMQRAPEATLAAMAAHVQQQHGHTARPGSGSSAGHSQSHHRSIATAIAVLGHPGSSQPAGQSYGQMAAISNLFGARDASASSAAAVLQTSGPSNSFLPPQHLQTLHHHHHHHHHHQAEHQYAGVQGSGMSSDTGHISAHSSSQTLHAMGTTSDAAGMEARRPMLRPAATDHAQGSADAGQGALMARWQRRAAMPASSSGGGAPSAHSVVLSTGSSLTGAALPMPPIGMIGRTTQQQSYYSPTEIEAQLHQLMGMHGSSPAGLAPLDAGGFAGGVGLARGSPRQPQAQLQLQRPPAGQQPRQRRASFLLGPSAMRDGGGTGGGAPAAAAVQGGDAMAAALAAKRGHRGPQRSASDRSLAALAREGAWGQHRDMRPGTDEQGS